MHKLYCEMLKNCDRSFRAWVSLAKDLLQLLWSIQHICLSTCMAKMLLLHQKETSSMQSMIQIDFNLETDRLVYIYNRVLLYLYLEIILFEWFLIETYLIIIGCSCLWFVSYEGDQWVLVVNEGKCAKIVLISSLISFLFLFLLHTSVNQHQLSGVLGLSSILATGFMTQTHMCTNTNTGLQYCCCGNRDDFDKKPFCLMQTHGCCQEY